MITKQSTLIDVCFEVSAILDLHGVPGVLTGGSAAAVYAPGVYASLDADYIRESHILRRGDACLRILKRTDCVRDRLRQL